MTSPTGASRPMRPHPDLDQLKRQAKELLAAFTAGESQAVAEVNQHYHDADPATFALHDAQLVIARSYGFESWTKLKAHVDRITVGTLADAVKKGDLPLVRKMLGDRPELVHFDMAENDEHRPLHYAVLNRKPELVKTLMEAGADARKGIYPHRDATSALTLAKERGYDEIVAIIEQEEQHRREAMSCPNATVSPVQDQINEAIRKERNDEAIKLLEEDESLIKACDRDGGTPLHIAAGALNEMMVAWLLNHHANVRKTDMHDKTPLDRAVLAVEMRNAGSLQKFPGIAKLLRDRGSELTGRSAVALGEAEYLRKLYTENPKAFAPEYSGGPLAIAVRHERLDMLRLLLDLGCDPDERIRLGNLEEEVYSWGFPLWHAAAMHRYDMAELLLQRKADPNAQVYASGGPLFQAFSQRDESMKELLRRYGAQDDAITIGLFRDTAMATRMLDHQPPELTRHAWAGQSVQEQLLWGGACGGDPEIVRMSLERIDWKRDDSRWFWMLEQPLRIWNYGPGHFVLDRSTFPVCFKLILDRCGPNIVGRFGVRIIQCLAARSTTLTTQERFKFAEMLLDAGADLKVRDDLLKSTPLGWSARWGREELVDILIQRGAAVNEPDAEPWATPLAWAEKMGHAEIAAKLRAAGAKINRD